MSINFEEEIGIVFNQNILYMKKSQYLNFLSISILELLDNFHPTQNQIDEIEEHLRNFFQNKNK
jgi:hypothetical protein